MANVLHKKTVLVAIDESEHSKRAFYYYLNSVSKPDDLVILIHIFNPPVPPALSTKARIRSNENEHKDHSHPFGHDLFLSDPRSEHWVQWRNSVNKTIEKLKQMLVEYENLCDEKKIARRAILHSGSPGEAICEIARENDANMIIIGSRGLNKLRRTFLGSVSDYVIHHAHRAVLVVPELR